MRTVMRCLSGLALWCAFAVAEAEVGPVPELSVPQVTPAPRIDGVLAEPCWQSAPPITAFRCVDKERAVPSQRTQAWIAGDADALYVAARCADDRMDQVPATVTESDGPVWRDDCLEVFLMPGTPYYYHFAANLLGARYDARHRLGAAADDSHPEQWQAEWQVASQRAADGWTMEIAIPLACLEWGAERLAAPCRLNLGREQHRLTEFSCWPASEFSKTAEFAHLVGLQLDPQRYGLLLEGVALGEVLPGANRCTATIAAEPVPGSALTLRARLRALPEGAEQTYSVVVTSAPGAQAALDYQMPLAGGRVSAVFECLDAQGRTRISQAARWRVPAPLEAALDLPLLYPSDGEVRLTGNVALRGATTLRASLLDGARRRASVSVPVGPDGLFRVHLPVRSLAPGRYVVETHLALPDATAQPVVNQFPFRLLAGPLD